MSLEARAVRILEAYGRAWIRRDPDEVAALFTSSATYQVDPFRAPLEGREAIREYWARSPGARQRDVRFQAGPAVQQGNAVFAEWEAGFTRVGSGRRISLRGILILRMEGDRIASLREYWNRRESEPP